jgi:hypothetical protein
MLARLNLTRDEYTNQVRVVEFVQDLNVLKLDVEELINGFEGSLNCDVVLEFDGDFMVHKSLEEAAVLPY